MQSDSHTASHEDLMEGSTSRRIARLLRHLAGSPGLIVPYLTHLPAWGKQPMDVGLPWFSFAAIRFLENFVSPHMTVFEWGGGGSTIFFARRAKRVVCIESNETWAARLQASAASLGLKNVDVYLHPFARDDEDAFLHSAYLNCISDFTPDVVVVDGYEDTLQLRPHCFVKAQQYARQGDAIIVDDSWRYKALQFLSRAQQHFSFVSTGPCRYGVTSTDVFLY